MTGFLSIIWRELAVGARQKATHRSRLLAAAIMMAIFMAILFFSGHNQQVLGPILFAVTYFILYVQALSSGIRLTADCLSEEKREGTLGLLYLSGLRGAGIVLGKMAVRSLRGVYILIATLPIFGFCILMGGVQGSDALTAGFNLLSTMFYSLAIGVFISSIASDEKTVFAGVVGILAAISILPYLLWWLILQINPAATWVKYLLWISPWISGTKDVWRQTLFHVLCGLLLLIISVWFLNRSFKKQFTASPSATGNKAMAFKSRVNAQLDQNPILWMLGLDTTSSIIAKLHCVFGLLAAIGVGLLAWKTPATFSMGPVMILYGFHFIWKLLVLSDALRRLHHDHRSGALELLLTTPINPNQILQAQAERTFRVFFPAAVALSLANLMWYNNKNFFDEFTFVPLGGALFLFIDGMALRWTAMAQAFQPSGFPAAIMRLAAKLIFLPLLALWLILMSGRSWTSSEFNTLFLFWFAACAAYDGILISRAKRQLKDLRLLASNEPPAKKAERRPLPKFIQWLFMTESAAPTPSQATQ